MQECLDEFARTSDFRALRECDAKDVKIEIERVRLNSQGYARNGRYFGLGEPLFEVCFDAPCGSFYHTFRAPGAIDLRRSLRSLLSK